MVASDQGIAQTLRYMNYSPRAYLGTDSLTSDACDNFINDGFGPVGALEPFAPVIISVTSKTEEWFRTRVCHLTRQNQLNPLLAFSVRVEVYYIFVGVHLIHLKYDADRSLVKLILL